MGLVGLPRGRALSLERMPDVLDAGSDRNDRDDNSPAFREADRIG